MVTKNSEDGGFQQSAHARNSLDDSFEGAEGRTAEIPREHADVVLERWNKLHEALHRAVVHVDMQVANMQQREALESLWERAECKISLSDLNISRIFQAAPVQASQPEGGPYQRVDRVPILDVEEIKSLTEDLGFVVRLNSKPLPRMQPAKAPFKPVYDGGLFPSHKRSFQHSCARDPSGRSCARKALNVPEIQRPLENRVPCRFEFSGWATGLK